MSAIDVSAGARHARLVELSEDAVPRRLRRIAAAAVSHASRELEVSRPTVHWCEVASPYDQRQTVMIAPVEHLTGFTPSGPEADGSIWINATPAMAIDVRDHRVLSTEARIAMVAFHETFHHARPTDVPRDPEVEAAAQAYDASRRALAAQMADPAWPVVRRR